MFLDAVIIVNLAYHLDIAAQFYFYAGRLPDVSFALVIITSDAVSVDTPKAIDQVGLPPFQGQRFTDRLSRSTNARLALCLRIRL